MALDPKTKAQEVRIDPPGLFAFLGVPEAAKGVVLFAHGSGSGRMSPRNNYVAEELRRAGIATLLLDLLTPAEEADRRNVFDIELLSSRLVEATKWVERQPETEGLQVAYFGASTGAGAALMAAAQRPDIAAVVSRGGRPDLAGAALARVRAPTLLLVGGADAPVIELNREAQAQMSGETELVIVPGASHLFEEPGALDEVIRHARNWFLTHFTGAAERTARPEAASAEARSFEGASMKVADLMTPNPQTISPDDNLRYAAELMDELDVGVLPVCDGDRLAGVITDRDITVRATAAGDAPETTTVAEAMTDEVRWCFEDDDVREAERMMRQLQVRRLPVLSHDRRLVGMITLGDLAAKGALGVRDTLDVISQPPQPDR